MSITLNIPQAENHKKANITEKRNINQNNMEYLTLRNKQKP